MDVNPLSRPSEPERPRRADAERNRAAILAAAAELFAEHGAASVSMDAVAERAGVGKPTLYRHFGDRAGLAHAVFEERERGFQARLIAEQGTGAPAGRIADFLDGYLGLVEAHLDVLAAAESARPGARFAVGAYASYRRLLAIWLGEAGVPEADRGYLADVLLATAAADLYRQQRDVEKYAPEEIRARARALAHRLVAAYATPGAAAGGRRAQGA